MHASYPSLPAATCQARSFPSIPFLETEVVPTLGQFASRRLEDVAIQHFRRLARAGKLPGARDFGSYWYDDPKAKTNGEFDCVIDRGSKLDFYECKYFDRPMALAECQAEEHQVRAIPGADVGAIGFVCPGGFDFESDAYELVSGADLYLPELDNAPR